MFDRSDRLTLYINVLLAAFGIIFALYSGFFLIGFIFTACALLLMYDLYRQNKTAFTIAHLDKILTIQDSSGNKATETQKATVTANKTGLSDFWFNNISSSGTISSININGASPAERKTEDGKIHAAMKFDAPIKAGNAFDATLSLGHQNAFTKTQETFVHTIDNETKLLRMIIELPAGRPAAFASLSRRYKDEETQALPPIITEHGKIVADIKNPPIGAEYCLHWDWPKAKLMDKLDDLFFYK
jgi:hypothetical protein